MSSSRGSVAVRASQRMASMKVRWSRAGRPVLGFCGGSKGARRLQSASLSMVLILTPPRWDQLTAAPLGLATRASVTILKFAPKLLPPSMRRVSGGRSA